MNDDRPGFYAVSTLDASPLTFLRKEPDDPAMLNRIARAVATRTDADSDKERWRVVDAYIVEFDRERDHRDYTRYRATLPDGTKVECRTRDEARNRIMEAVDERARLGQGND